MTVNARRHRSAHGAWARLAMASALCAALPTGAALAAKPAVFSTAHIEAELAKGNTAAAIVKGEAGVAAQPGDAALRSALGRAYLKAGRYQSAVAMLGEAVSLGETGARSLLSLALAQIVTGDDAGAVASLDKGVNAIPPADLGLALALAGATERGARVLGDAVRAGDTSEKLRANLAYAYALDGRWAEARNLVAMDLPEDKVDARLTEWAQSARPESRRERVSAMLGVPVSAGDPGRPLALALSAAPAPAQLAEVKPAPEPAAARTLALAASAPLPAAPQPLVQQPAAAEPVATASLPAVVAPQPAPPARRVAIAKPQHRRNRVTPLVVVAAVEKPAPEKSAPEKPAGEFIAPTGSHAVQLGAFAIEGNATRARALFLRRDPELKAHDVTITKALVNGKYFWRVSATGFGVAQASDKCHALQGKGLACMAYAPGHLPGEVGAALARR